MKSELRCEASVYNKLLNYGLRSTFLLILQCFTGILK